jgi:predicted kinase
MAVCMGAVKGLWNIVLSGYPKSGKTMLANRLVAENKKFARIGVDELRKMLFNEAPPCRDEFLVYSIIAQLRDYLLKKGYSVVIDSTAPDNVTRAFLLMTNVKNVNRLVILFNVEREVIIERNIALFGDATPISVWDERWEAPPLGVPIFKFKSNNMEEFEAYYARLAELLESEMHPFKPEFQRALESKRRISMFRKLLKKRF